MRVAQILESKGRKVITTPAGATVNDAVNTLADNAVGVTVATTDSGEVAGILSERDVVRGLARHGAELLSAPVTALMSTSVITCQPDASLEDVMELMTSNQVRHLPVVEDGQLVGLLSIVDVVRVLLARAQLNQEAMRAAS